MKKILITLVMLSFSSCTKSLLDSKEKIFETEVAIELAKRGKYEEAEKFIEKKIYNSEKNEIKKKMWIETIKKGIQERDKLKIDYGLARAYRPFENLDVKERKIIYEISKSSQKIDKWVRYYDYEEGLCESLKILLSEETNTRKRIRRLISDKADEKELHKSIENLEKKYSKYLFTKMEKREWKDAEIILNEILDKEDEEAVEDRKNIKDKNNKTALMYAAQYDNTEICKLLINRGENINAKDKDGKTALYYAVFEYPNIEIAKYLIGSGADIEIKSENGETLLTSLLKPYDYGSSTVNESIIYSLISKGADVNAKNGERETALTLAAAANRKDICELLIRNGADVNVTYVGAYNGWLSTQTTPLIDSAEKVNKEICELLIKSGADVNAKNGERETALTLAAAANRKDICELLIRNGADVSAYNKYGKSAFHGAVEVGNKYICELLIRKGANVNGTYNGWSATQITPLIDSAEKGHKEICELLIKNGANVNLADGSGSTALHRAAERGHKEICELLIEYGADIDFKNEAGYTAVILAVKRDDKKMLDILLENGACLDVDSVVKLSDREIFSNILAFAAQKGSKEICELLISKGADVNANSKNGLTALVCASEHGNKEIVKMLLKAGADVNLSCESIDYNYCQVKGATPLMAAAWIGHEEIVKILLKVGANVNSSCECSNDEYSQVKGVTALMLAAINTNSSAKHNNINLVKILLKAGADINAATSVEVEEVSTLLMLAAISNNINLVKLLLKAGADVNHENSEGKTAIDIAKEKGHKEIVDLLMSYN